MKARALTVTIEREISMTVYAPVGTSRAAVLAAAKAEVPTIEQSWDPDPWELDVSGGEIVDISDEQCGLGTGHMAALNAGKIVKPADAGWWHQAKAGRLADGGAK
jgi:hypothetical protein